MAEHRLRIGITQGDTNGIGWEVILKTFADPRMTELCTPVIYGSPRAAAFYRDRIEGLDECLLTEVTTADEARRGKVNLVPVGAEELAVEPGQPTREAAHAAVESLRTAVEELRAHRIDALVTAPFNKESMHEDRFPFTGHTEFLASELGGEPLMIMCSDVLRVGLATIHLPLSEVSRAITPEGIVRALRLLRQSLVRDFGIVEPRIAVLALNPHAGDGGLLGPEEEEIIRPAIRTAAGEGILAFGPFAADGLFAGCGYMKYDAVLAMYHDQGLAPFKALTPDGVNFTAGLSEIRTSPDHGTAYDIAGRGVADPQSMRNAVYAAIDITTRRRAWEEWSRRPLQRAERDRSNRDVSVRDLPDPEKEAAAEA